MLLQKLRYEEQNLCVAILYMLWYNIIEVIIMTASIHCKVDAEVKKQAEAVFKEAGLNTSTAINLFLKQAVIFKGIPFPIYTEKHNELNKLWAKIKKEIISDAEYFNEENMNILKAAIRDLRAGKYVEHELIEV